VTSPSLESWFASTLKNKSALSDPALQPLSKLTVVVPCYGRQDFLLRQCVYWHKSGVSLVIVDGSPQALPESVRNRIAALGDAVYLYADVSMMERLRMAAEQIKTPYAILVGDDEFLLFTGLASAIQQLEQEPALAACIAQSLAFYPSEDGSECTYGAGYPHWQYAVTHASIKERFTAAMTDYTAATCYAVLREDVWRKSWGQMQKWSSPYTSEMLQGLMTYILGQLKTVDEIYWMRSSENKPVTSVTFNRGLSFKEWWHSAKFESEHVRFMDTLCAEMERTGDFTREQAEFAIRDAMQLFIVDADRVAKAGAPAGSSFRGVLIALLKALLPDTLFEHLKSMRFESRKLGEQGELGNLQALQAIKTPTPYLMTPDLVKELGAMEQLIADFYQARTIQK